MGIITEKIGDEGSTQAVGMEREKCNQEVVARQKDRIIRAQGTVGVGEGTPESACMTAWLVMITHNKRERSSLVKGGRVQV